MIKLHVAAAAVAAALLLAGCAGGYYAVPNPIADAQPIPTRCPNYVPGCQPPPPETHEPSPEPEPTSTATAGGGPKPIRTRSPRPGTQPPPSTPTTLPSIAGVPGGPKPPPGSTFVAFTFQALPFEQAFPLDPPPPPPPVKRAVPTALVSLAAVLVSGVAASAGIASRRRGRMVVV